MLLSLFVLIHQFQISIVFKRDAILYASRQLPEVFCVDISAVLSYMVR